ncbi:hypothetical protein GCM10011492_14890 [Flexivirga endophytica]|uniref:Gram-positive cocci surface proteins LPxTG domain-containing protein n=1 Tax=Flexivirga endophytica TaxID=1849103 RepID=A0A916T081_9MICO|nr:hypothetical protein [Flexivirga endophytica]GGB25768.1 hypothetical protein GCM10011492_14890 [Flexivirga endophytica]GHB54362.1 hypothetical protein GCM10008112_24210 [Flexivirga endophytica]
MASRLVRSATAVALASSATTFAYVGSAAPAQAAGYNGYCKTSSGVTVVVDFRNLGGGVAIRCSPVGSGATGLQALQAAGIPVEGTRDGGLSVACRIYGKPTATQDLPGGYHEQCVRMPPGKAYWSYWQASNGGSWGYSQEGLSNSHVIPGGFEGWSFSEGGSNVAPGAAPSRPTAPKPTTTTTQPPAPPRHTTTTAPRHDPAPSKHDGGTSAGSQPKSTTSTAAERKAEAKAKAAKASRSASKSASASKSSHSSSSSAGASSGSTSASSGAAVDAGGQPLSNSDDLIKDSKKKSSSINATTVVGGGVLAALAIGGGVVAIIRRRNLE